jgi:carbonic anhydrase
MLLEKNRCSSPDPNLGDAPAAGRDMFEIVYRHDPARPHTTSLPRDATEAKRRLEGGNQDFAHVFHCVPARQGVLRRIVLFDPQDLGVSSTTGAPPKQQPFAVVLGCSDARVPTELIFNQWCNELFVIRVAGNVLGLEVLGSIEYAIGQLRDTIKLLVVLAHSGCGAVTAAVDVFLKPASYLAFVSSHPLRMIIDRLFVVVCGAARSLEMVHGEKVTRHPGYRLALIETTVALNGALSAFTLKQELARRHDDNGAFDIVYGVYDLDSRCVHLPGLHGSRNVDRLASLHHPPADTVAFADLARRLAGSDYTARLLAGG